MHDNHRETISKLNNTLKQKGVTHKEDSSVELLSFYDDKLNCVCKNN